ncbi:hypothetical protein SS50377_21240 [Spironucleus salmonicida]|uniref:Uncharacterized protein n=1 Tax=Spironucleus salmonicida TaxID=348837 RepID=V6LHI5_9EUKA|nr:hypothetical protein SS50377_21240 [Spironucleus salmonicida]|eukprot:EST44012.1 hypothetical protein SS50377_16321 [Spironucleus salmonicida]
MSNSALKDLLAKTIEERDTTVSNYQSIQNTIFEKEIKIQEQENRNSDLLKRITILENDKQQLQSTSPSYQQEIQLLTNQLKKLQTQNEILKSERPKISDAFRPSLTEETSMYQSKTDTEFTPGPADLDALRYLQEQKIVVEQDLLNCKQELQLLQQKYEVIYQEKVQANILIDSLNKQNTELSNILELMDQDMEDQNLQQKKIIELSNSNQACGKELTLEKAKYNQVNQEKLKVTGQLEQIKNQLDKKCHQFNCLEEAYFELDKEQQYLQVQTNKNLEHIKELEEFSQKTKDSLLQSTTQISLLREQNENYLQDIKDSLINASVNSGKDEQSKYIDQINTLKEQNLSKQQLINDLKEQLATILQQGNIKQENLEKLKEQQAIIQDLQYQVQELHNKRQEYTPDPMDTQKITLNQSQQTQILPQQNLLVVHGQKTIPLDFESLINSCFSNNFNQQSHQIIFKIKELQDKIQMLSNKIKSIDQQQHQLVIDNSILSQELNDQLINQNATKQFLADQVQDLKHSLLTLTQTNIQVDQALLPEVSIITDQSMDMILQDFAVVSTNFKQLLQSNNSQNNQQYDEILATSLKLSSQKNDISSENEKLKQELHTSISAIQQLAIEKEKISLQNKSLQTENSQLLEDIKKLSDSCLQMDGVLSSVRMTQNSLQQDDIDECNKVNQALILENKQLKIVVDNKQNAIEGYESQIQHAQQQISTVLQDQTELKQLKVDLDYNNSNLLKQVQQFCQSQLDMCQVLNQIKLSYPAQKFITISNKINELDLKIQNNLTSSVSKQDQLQQLLQITLLQLEKQSNISATKYNDDAYNQILVQQRQANQKLDNLNKDIQNIINKDTTAGVNAETDCDLQQMLSSYQDVQVEKENIITLLNNKLEEKLQQVQLLESELNICQQKLMKQVKDIEIKDLNLGTNQYQSQMCQISTLQDNYDKLSILYIQSQEQLAKQIKDNQQKNIIALKQNDNIIEEIKSQYLLRIENLNKQVSDLFEQNSLLTQQNLVIKNQPQKDVAQQNIYKQNLEEVENLTQIKINQLSQKFNESQIQVSELQQQLLLKDANQTTFSIMDQQKQIDRIKQQYNQVIDDLNTQITTQTLLNQSLLSKIKLLNQEILTLKNTQSELEQQNKSCTQKYEQLYANNQNNSLTQKLQENIENLENQVIVLKNFQTQEVQEQTQVVCSQKHQQDIDNLQQQLEHQQQLTESESKHYEEYQANTNELKKQIQNLQIQVSNKNNASTEYQDQLFIKDQAILELKRQILNLQSEINQRQQQDKQQLQGSKSISLCSTMQDSLIKPQHQDNLSILQQEKQLIQQNNNQVKSSNNLIKLSGQNQESYENIIENQKELLNSQNLQIQQMSKINSNLQQQLIDQQISTVNTQNKYQGNLKSNEELLSITSNLKQLVEDIQCQNGKDIKQVDASFEQQFNNSQNLTSKIQEIVDSLSCYDIKQQSLLKLNQEQLQIMINIQESQQRNLSNYRLLSDKLNEITVNSSCENEASNDQIIIQQYQQITLLLKQALNDNNQQMILLQQVLVAFTSLDQSETFKQIQQQTQAIFESVIKFKNNTNNISSQEQQQHLCCSQNLVSQLNQIYDFVTQIDMKTIHHKLNIVTEKVQILSPKSEYLSQFKSLEQSIILILDNFGKFDIQSQLGQKIEELKVFLQGYMDQLSSKQQSQRSLTPQSFQSTQNNQSPDHISPNKKSVSFQLLNEQNFTPQQIDSKSPKLQQFDIYNYPQQMSHQQMSLSDNNEINHLKVKVELLETQLQQFKLANSAIQNEEYLQRQVARYELDLKNTLEEYDMCKRQIIELKNHIEVQDLTIKEQKTEIEDLQNVRNKYDRLSQTKDLQDEQLANLRQVFSELRNLIRSHFGGHNEDSELINQVENLLSVKRKFMDLEKEMIDLKAQLAASEEQRKSFRKRAREERNFKERSEQHVHQLEHKVDKQQQQLTKYRADIQEIRQYAQEYASAVQAELKSRLL